MGSILGDLQRQPTGKRRTPARTTNSTNRFREVNGAPPVRPRPIASRLSPNEMARQTARANTVGGFNDMNTRPAAIGHAEDIREWMVGRNEALGNQGFQQTLPFDGGGGGGGYGRGYGRGGGGGGGGGNDDEKHGTLKQIGFLQDLLRSGQFNPQQMTADQRTYQRDDALYGRLDQAYAADQAQSSGAYDQLDDYLGRSAAAGSAYDQVGAAQAPQADTSSLMALLGSQGGDTRALQAEGQLLQAGGQQDAAAFDRLISTLGANDRTGMASRQSESAMARAYATNQLGANKLGASTALDMREQARREGIEQSNYAATQAASQTNFQATTAAQSQRLQLMQQIAQLAAQFNFDMPTLEALGIGG